MALHVVAIDFGTTYSGYAFSVSPPHTELKDVEILSNRVWNSGTAEVASLKTPTCILLTKERDLVAFGYEAEEQYADIVLDGNANDFYFFHRFKMNLHNDKNITMSLVLEDVRGQPLPAIDVFSLSIQALKDHLDNAIDVKNMELDKKKTKWVLTVPAIWTDTAKQFMRKSAENDNYSKRDPVNMLNPATFWWYACPKSGARGTVDITLHEKNRNGTLKEVVKASGNDCGGTSIDDEFIHMFVCIFGEPIMNSLKLEFPDSYLYLLRKIENVKRVYQISQTRNVNITIPRSTLDGLCQSYLGENITAVINSSSLASNIEIIRDKMRIKPLFVESLFKATCDHLVSLVQSVLQQCALPNISNILLVGGFAECKMIQKTMKTAFPNKNIILQEDSSTVVLKGAVLFGYKSDYISSRIARYTYGLKVWPHFDENIHDKKRKVIWNENAYCDNTFFPFIEISTPVPKGHTIEKIFGTHSTSGSRYHFYYTESTDVKYTDTGECSFLGGFDMHFSNPDRKKMKVTFNFGDTEFSVTVLDPKSGSERKVFFENQR